MTQDNKVIKLETFSTHFFTNGADKHFIIAEDYKIFIESIEQILANINTELLKGQAKYELCIVANKEGGFWSTVGVLGTLISIPAALDSELIHGFYTGLTGHDYDLRSVGENVGSFLRDATVGIFSKNATELSKIIPQEPRGSAARRGRQCHRPRHCRRRTPPHRGPTRLSAHCRGTGPQTGRRYS